MGKNTAIVMTIMWDKADDQYPSGRPKLVRFRKMNFLERMQHWLKGILRPARAAEKLLQNNPDTRAGDLTAVGVVIPAEVYHKLIGSTGENVSVLFQKETDSALMQFIGEETTDAEECEV